MCGILGSFGTHPNRPWVIAKINELSRRGPDSSKVEQADNLCVLGATRLAMVDRHSRSNQPLRKDKDWICFNGEIYNYLELKESYLQNSKMTTASDTEVLLEMLIKYKTKTFEYVEGMYSIAFYDSSAQTLYLYRDALGKKPLYYREFKGGVFFSSQIDTLYNENEFRSLELKNFYDYNRLGYFIDPKTWHPEIFSVQPGMGIEFALEDDAVRKRVFPITLKKALNVNNRNSSKSLEGSKLRSIIVDAVSKRVSGHDRVSLSLSGGVDSTIIAIVLSSLDVKVDCYSAFWPDSDKPRYNRDAEAAEIVSRKLGLNFKPVAVFDAEQVPKVLGAYLEAMGEPNSNATGLSMMSVYSAIKSDGHRLTLTGDGADEVFGGYARYAEVNKYLSRFGFLRPIFSFLGRESIPEKIDAVFQNSPQGWLYWHQILSKESYIEYFLNNKTEPTFDYVEDDFLSRVTPQYNFSKVDALKKLMQTDSANWLTNESNRRLDRVSMYYSIEARSPFQDLSVTSILNQLDKVSLSRSLGKKHLICAFPELENLLTENEKLGFISPIGHWLRVNVDEVISSLKDMRTRLEIPLVGENDLQEYMFSGDFKKLNILWNWYVLSVWIKKYSYHV